MFRETIFVLLRSYGYSARRGRTLQHIREAEALSVELGGTDEDVKQYFFALDQRDLAAVLDEYESRHGRAQRQYAEEAIPAWRSRRSRMSGLVAGRLYDLLPPRMPIEAKYGLAETLWKRVGPRSHRRLRIGPDASEDHVADCVRRDVEQIVGAHAIPEALQRRFRWLSGGDVRIQEQLWNHLQGLEKDLAVTTCRDRIPILLKRIREEGEVIRALTDTLEIGNHRFELDYDPTATGVRLEQPSPFSTDASRGARAVPKIPEWLWFILAIAALIASFAVMQRWSGRAPIQVGVSRARPTSDAAPHPAPIVTDADRSSRFASRIPVVIAPSACA